MSTLARDLAAQVGPSRVMVRPADLASYAFDAFGAAGERHLPDAVVFPGNTDEVSAVVRVCAHHGVPIVPRGAGTGYAGGAVALGGGVILNPCRMTRVLPREADATRGLVEAGAITPAGHPPPPPPRPHYPPPPRSAPPPPPPRHP